MRPVRPRSSLIAASSARLAGGEPSYPTTICRNSPDGAAVVTVVSLDPGCGRGRAVGANGPPPSPRTERRLPDLVGYLRYQFELALLGVLADEIPSDRHRREPALG